MDVLSASSFPLRGLPGSPWESGQTAFPQVRLQDGALGHVTVQSGQTQAGQETFGGDGHVVWQAGHVTSGAGQDTSQSGHRLSKLGQLNWTSGHLQSGQVTFTLGQVSLQSGQVKLKNGVDKVTGGGAVGSVGS